MNGTLFSFEKIIAIIQILLGIFFVLFSIYNELVIINESIEYYGRTWEDISLFKLFKRNIINLSLGIIAVFGGLFLLKDNLKGWILSLTFFISTGIVTLIRFIQILNEGVEHDDNLGIFFIFFVILSFFLIAFFLVKPQFLLKYLPKKNNWFFIVGSIVFFVLLQFFFVF